MIHVIHIYVRLMFNEHHSCVLLHENIAVNFFQMHRL